MILVQNRPGRFIRSVKVVKVVKVVEEASTPS